MITQLFYSLLEQLIGVYQPLMATQYLPIYTVDDVTGQMYISHYQEVQQTIEGLSGVNFSYILAFILFIIMLKLTVRSIMLLASGMIGSKHNKLL